MRVVQDRTRQICQEGKKHKSGRGAGRVTRDIREPGGQKDSLSCGDAGSRGAASQGYIATYVFVCLVLQHFSALYRRKIKHGSDHMRHVRSMYVHHVLIDNVAKVCLGVLVQLREIAKKGKRVSEGGCKESARRGLRGAFAPLPCRNLFHPLAPHLGRFRVAPSSHRDTICLV